MRRSDGNACFIVLDPRSLANHTCCGCIRSGKYDTCKHEYTLCHKQRYVTFVGRSALLHACPIEIIRPDSSKSSGLTPSGGSKPAVWSNVANLRVAINLGSLAKETHPNQIRNRADLVQVVSWSVAEVTHHRMFMRNLRRLHNLPILWCVARRLQVSESVKPDNALI